MHDSSLPSDWSVHVSTVQDERSLVAVCGVIVSPQNGSTLDARRRGKVVARAHGTLGIAQACQPSNDPTQFIFGPSPSGMGAIAWGSTATKDEHLGTAADGVLQTWINQGRLVAATDYYVGLSEDGDYQRYMVATSSAAQVLDSVRAGIELAARKQGVRTRNWDLALYGHSQGGHSALWAGQIANLYYSATRPIRNTTRPAIALAGIVGVAPASNFVAPADAPESTWGTHLAVVAINASSTMKLRVLMNPVLVYPKHNQPPLTLMSSYSPPLFIGILVRVQQPDNE